MRWGMANHSNLIFHVERWDAKDIHVEEVISASSNTIVAIAAYDAAVALMPTANLMLRHGARIIRRTKR